MWRVTAFVALAAAATTAEPLYDFETSPLIQLDDSNFESVVLKDDSALWVVEFYADWCGHCKQFKAGFEKAAKNLEGIVKFGAVNADSAKKTQQAAGVQGFPSVKVYVPGSSQKNPYTGKISKPALDYSGPRTARGVVDFATANLESKVVAVSDASLKRFRGNGTLPKALLFTKKTETTPLLKSLSIALNGRMVIGEARDVATKAVAEFGITDFPTLIVLPGEEGAAPIKYEGELKPAALSAFLESHAAAAPAPAAGGAATEDSSSAIEITSSNVAELVDGERTAWLLIFPGSEEADIPSPGISALSDALRGQVSVGKASADLAPKFGVTLGPKPALAMWPFRKPGRQRKAEAFEGSEEGVAAAKKAALESLPADGVETLSGVNMDRWMQEAMMTSDSKAFTILFSDKKEVPPLLRALSLEFEGKLGFGMAQAADKQLASRFNVQKAPTLLVMFPDESKADEKTGNVPLTGMQFMPQMHGKFNFGNIANFLASVVEMRLQQAGKSGEATGGAGGDSSGSAKPAKAAKVKGPAPELTLDSFEAECVQKGGLCGIAMIDGAAENSNKATQVELVSKLRQRKAGSAIAVSWIDATCHVNFAAAFGLSEVDLPTMIFLSPGKLKWARSVGAFDVETLSAFGERVAAGKKATETLSEMPPLEDVDCATIKRGADAVVEEDGADDIMAEILEEERRAREEREKELAAEGVAAAGAEASSGKKKKSEMSKLELLEADVEECEAMDLLCNARRDKQLKAVEKQRDLEAKLAEIAKKKKKKAKKAKKAAAGA